MMDPIFWLGLSILLVAVSITAVLMAIIPAVQELGRAARSAEKLFDTLSRELPPTLDAIRQTGLEITNLTDDVSEGVQSAGQVVKQVDASLGEVKQQAHQVSVTTRSVFAGFKAAWQTLTTSEVTTATSLPSESPAPTSQPQVSKPQVKSDAKPLDSTPDFNHHPVKPSVQSTAQSTAQSIAALPTPTERPSAAAPTAAVKPTHAPAARLSTYAIDPTLDPHLPTVGFDATDQDS
ncbi:MAG: hypothetical protein VKJ24_16340 [Synechococcales bacterium]|nr:hypothetical protein [Synechococcales bacterium]